MPPAAAHRTVPSGFALHWPTTNRLRLLPAWWSAHRTSWPLIRTTSGGRWTPSSNSSPFCWTATMPHY